MNKKQPWYKRIVSHTLLYTLLAIVVGILLGAVVFAVSGYNPLEAYVALFKGVFGDPASIVWMIIRATPLILTGLSITFAFQTGLFNVGAEGQFMIGTMAAVAVGSLIELPAIIHVPLTLLAGMLAAGIWGGISGFMKAKFGVSEVISTIMLNWIAFYLNNYLVTIKSFTSMYKVNSLYIHDSASINLFTGLKASDAGRQMMSDGTTMGNIMKTPVNYGIIIALVAVVVVWFILRKTTLGYELKAVGFNSTAAEYGGIDTNKRMFISMCIAGMLAGAAGAVHVMGNAKCISILAVSEGYGFDGMAVSLIGGGTPLGTLLGAILYATLQYGGMKVQGSIGAPTEVISIVTGAIVFFIAMPKCIQAVAGLLRKRKGRKQHA